MMLDSDGVRRNFCVCEEMCQEYSNRYGENIFRKGMIGIMKDSTVSMEQLYKITVRLFMGMGYGEKEAAYAADVLVETDRRGVDTHGVVRLDFYHMCVHRDGWINRNAQLQILRDDPPYLMVDADHGLGIIMTPQAVELAIERAKEQGVCVMGIRNSNHFGAAGYYAQKCVDQGFIALVCSNSPGTMVPIDGNQGVLGNSPWSMAIPGGNRYPDPIMFDMACSEVSRGKCETALRNGERVPPGWGVDRHGEPTTDPARILSGGFLLPFGGVKGYCVALLVEALSSMLTFASYGKGKNMKIGRDHEHTGHFVLLLDPKRFGEPEAYRDSIDAYVDTIKNSELVPGADEIIVPGELEARAIRERTANGMLLEGAVVSMLSEIARKTGQLTKGQRFRDMLKW
jgi:LDH2 family malate/lactate/ureidoglycolate dehydrogenase